MVSSHLEDTIYKSEPSVLEATNCRTLAVKQSIEKQQDSHHSTRENCCPETRNGLLYISFSEIPLYTS